MCIPANPSTFCRSFPHLKEVFCIPLKILRKHKFYRTSIDFPPNGCQVSHSGQWCLPVRDREKELETGDGQMSRTRERGSLWRLFRENTKTFLNGILHHVRVDSRFSRPNVGRYAVGKAGSTVWYDIFFIIRTGKKYWTVIPYRT